ncbi:hypothetical protein CEP53_003060 [Fusarium sp. AF-6]|nr:hypothetical protein CEP53_003060 [Fusarium sp. AF-6]
MASPHDPVFEEEVYLAFKPILKGPKAEIRKSKVVLPIIDEHSNHTHIKALLHTHSKTVVCQSLCRLLNEQIFESEAKASRRFANNHRTVVVPPAPLVPESPASELTFLRAPNSESGTGAGMIHQVVPESDSDFVEDYGGNGDTLEENEPELDMTALYESKYPTETSKLQVLLPLRIQNLILSRVQAILELTCFEFAKEKMPKILENRKWRCPTAGELNLWVAEFNKRIVSFKNNVNKPEGYEISKCFQAATHIRHFAVHRRHLSMAHLQSLVNNAEGLCKILGNSTALTQIELIWGYAQAQISELESFKLDIVVELESGLDDIAARRAELDLLEAASISKAHDKLNRHHDLASDELEKILLDRHMVLIAAGKMEVGKKGDQEDESNTNLPEEMDDQPPEEAKVEQFHPVPGRLQILQQRTKQSIMLVQGIYNSLNSLMTRLHTVGNQLLWLSSVLFGIAAAYILGPVGMEHMWSVLWWGEW